MYPWGPKSSSLDRQTGGTRPTVPGELEPPASPPRPQTHERTPWDLPAQGKDQSYTTKSCSPGHKDEDSHPAQTSDPRVSSPALHGPRSHFGMVSCWPPGHPLPPLATQAAVRPLPPPTTPTPRWTRPPVLTRCPVQTLAVAVTTQPRHGWLLNVCPLRAGTPSPASQGVAPNLIADMSRTHETLRHDRVHREPERAQRHFTALNKVSPRVQTRAC